MFDWGILKEKSYSIPVICVGNITVGGTGKTPHVEYLINLLKPTYKVAVLSRGYKRKTKGFVLAKSGCNAATIGDEPFQIYSKFPQILVAVDEKRCRGIENLLALDEKKRPDVILLDDAFQHRYVKPGFSLLLMDFNRLPFEDSLLPVGNLREPLSAKKRADVVIITKTDEAIKPIDISILKKNLDLYPFQSLFFTRFAYSSFVPVFNNENKKKTLSDSSNLNFSVLLVTGIASTESIIQELKRLAIPVEKHLKYPDHYSYTANDISLINTEFEKIKKTNKIVLFTEKDAVKIRAIAVHSKNLRKNMYYLPIEVRFLYNEETDFELLINKYVRANKRSGSLS